MKKILILPILALNVIITSAVIAGTMGPDVTEKKWTGLYAGASGGAGLATAASSFDIGSFSTATETGTFSAASHELNGFLAGGQAGYNYQLKNVLLGFEGEGSWTNIQGVAPCIQLLSCSANIRWTADASARLGVLPTNGVLVYVKGGVAWTGVNYNLSSVSGIYVGGTTTISSNVNASKTGGLLGIGTEYLLNPHWTAKIEYNYADYGTYTNNFLLKGASLGINLPVSTELQMHAIKVGVNYLI